MFRISSLRALSILVILSNSKGGPGLFLQLG